MLYKLIKKTFISFLVVVTFFSGFDPTGIIYMVTSTFSREGTHSGIVDKIYLAGKNKNVVDVFFHGQERAHAAINAAEKEYMITIGPIVGSTTANYVYATFFNPSGSGRTASIKRLAVRANTASSTASNYVNLSVRRITSASVGTQITAANFPQKNASSSSSIMEVRYAGVTVTLAGTVDSRILGQPLSGAVGSYYSNRDVTFVSTDEKIVLQPGEGIAVYQEAAGTAASKVSVTIEWDETANVPSAGDEFLFAFPRVEVAATANYAYNSFFNPASSGKTAIIRRIWFGSETCDAAAVYTNSIVLKRTSAASAGTAISASNIPKKNTSSNNSVMDFRHTNVTVTQVGGTDARLGHVTPCGTTAQAHGWQQINFDTNDERLVLQQGEGIALVSETAGNINQLVRMIVEWDEVPVANTPSPQGEYIWASGKIASSTLANTTLYSFFNPATSGKTAVIKRIAILANATTTAAYTSFQWRRLSAASGGTQVATSSFPQKNTSSASSSMEIRWCAQGCTTIITATYSGTADSRLLSVTGPGAVGQTIGQTEIVFGADEKLVLQPGEGIGLYNDVLTSSLGESVKVLIEWGEQASVPTSQGEYLMNIGPINGNTATTYNYMSFFNPAGSGKTAILKRVRVRVDTIGAAVYVPMSLRRITAASAGTVIASSSYPKKNSSSATSVVEVRTTGPTVGYAGATTSALMTIQTPGAVASAAAGNNGYQEIDFSDSEPLTLRPGEGIVLYQTPTAGSANFRVRLLVEWAEQVSTPTSLGEYLMAIGPVNQSTAAGYVYATIFNPINSAKNYILRKIGLRIDRSAAATTPTYTPVAVRRLTSASAGTLVATTSIAKNTNSANPTAEIRSTGVTASLSGVTDSRLLAVTAPGVVNQPFADLDTSITLGDELVLAPGQGVALYQEQANGDANIRYNFLLEWAETGTSSQPQSITFSVSTSTIYFGIASSVITRYASSTNTSGSDIEVDAHVFTVLTNAANGYTVTARGATLSSSSSTIVAIGNVATSSQVGVSQFGIRLTAIGGSGTTTSPYNTSGYAYGATATTSSQVARASIGDNATTTFAVRYVANIDATTPAASYTTNIVYVATANF